MSTCQLSGHYRQASKRASEDEFAGRLQNVEQDLWGTSHKGLEGRAFHAGFLLITEEVWQECSARHLDRG